MRWPSTFQTISRRDRRALSLGIIAIVGGLGLARGVPAVRGWSTMSVASASEVVAEAERAHRTVKGASALADTMSARSARFVALAPSLLDGASVATASATLASLVSGAAAASNAKLGSVQLAPAAAARDSSGTAPRAFARVSVRASLTADVRGLSQFLLALERGPTLLSVEEISVTQAEPGAERTRPEILHVDLVVAGLALVRQETDR